MFDDFLPDGLISQLDAQVAEEEPRLFEIAFDSNANSHGYAGSRRLWQAPGGLGPCGPAFTAAVSARLGDLFSATEIQPCPPARYEYELNAQFDGVFFERPIDSDFGPAAAARTTDRVISAVYYFSRPSARHSGIFRGHPPATLAANWSLSPSTAPSRRYPSPLSAPGWSPFPVSPGIRSPGFRRRATALPMRGCPSTAGSTAPARTPPARLRSLARAGAKPPNFLAFRRPLT
ncbi:hypothetical protein WG900_07000 [Novosphingobium sp. AS3R-12]|uniref:Uncharacterized protein n=1 Tax=Novosphingobium aquae TaxID=3133435 RepID=A0ABU8S6R8_9SPHN